MDNLSYLADAVKTIALEAGEKIMTVYGDESLFQVESKSDSSPLTQADLLSNAVIIEGLKRLKTNYPIVSEESQMIDYDTRKEAKRLWMVDPLDGTKEFIKRNGDFTVNIALIEGGYPILGVVYVPVENTLFWAFKQGGAFAYDGSSVTTLQACDYKPEDTGLRIVCSRSHLNDLTKAYIDAHRDALTVSRGSSLKFLLLAMGQAEIYPRMAPTMEWDTAAAQVILEEAGGSVIHFETAERLNYNKENLLNPYFIARAAEK